MYCSKCGSSLSADSAFCGKCGAPTGRRMGLTPAPPAQSAYPSATAQAAYADPAGLVASRSFVYAGFWLRFVAFVIDAFIVGCAILLLLVPLLFLTGLAANLEALAQSRGQPNPAIVGGLIAVIVLFALVAVLVRWLYHAYLESGENQATWGKQALGIYVTDLTGNRITFGRASGRFFAKIISGMIPLAIGYIMAGFTDRKQALHDMIASCLVLRR